MIQVILEIFQAFCRFMGPWIAPFFLPLFNPFLLISSFIPIMLGVMLSSNNLLNSNEQGEKDWSKGSKWSFLIYYIVFFTLSCSIMQISCHVGEKIGVV